MSPEQPNFAEQSSARFWVEPTEDLWVYYDVQLYATQYHAYACGAIVAKATLTRTVGEWARFPYEAKAKAHKHNLGFDRTLTEVQVRPYWWIEQATGQIKQCCE